MQRKFKSSTGFLAAPGILRVEAANLAGHLWYTGHASTTEHIWLPNVNRVEGDKARGLGVNVMR